MLAQLQQLCIIYSNLFKRWPQWRHAVPAATSIEAELSAAGSKHEECLRRRAALRAERLGLQPVLTASRDALDFRRTQPTVGF